MPEQPVGRRPLIVIVGADKGGVGKTFVARAFLDYAARLGVRTRAVDTESGPGVLRRFHPAAEGIDVATVLGQMSLVDAAGPDAVTVVDARAGALSAIATAFDRIRLLEDVRAGELHLMVLHVVGPTIESDREVATCAQALDGAVIVTVRNHVSALATFPQRAPTQVVADVPNLDQAACEAVDRACVGFAAFANDARNSRVLRGHVSAWLADVHAAFDAAGVGAALKG